MFYLFLILSGMSSVNNNNELVVVDIKQGEEGNPSFSLAEHLKCPKCHMNNMQRCITVSWVFAIDIVLVMILSVALRADTMFQEQDVGETDVNDRLIHKCNATLKMDMSGCTCVCTNSIKCHKLWYELSLSESANNISLQNEWTSDCHCSDYENVVTKGTMRCTIKEKGMMLEGYGREPNYRIMVIALLCGFSAFVLVFCGCGGTLIAFKYM